MPAWLLGTVAGALVFVVGLLVLRFRRRPPMGIEGAISEVALAVVRDVVIPDGMDGEIHLEALVLTAGGLVVIDVKDVRGSVFLGERLDDWKVLDGIQRYSFPNPLDALSERVAAVRYNAGDIACDGVVLFGPYAQIRGNLPPGVCLPSDLVRRYPRPTESECRQLREAYAPHWESLKKRFRTP